MSHEPRLRDYLTRDEVTSLLRAAKMRIPAKLTGKSDDVDRVGDAVRGG